MIRPKEWFITLDDGYRVIGPRGSPDVTSAILAANSEAPWPSFRGDLMVRSDRDDTGTKVGEGGGRMAATRRAGRWSGTDVVAGHGYLVEPDLMEAHERRHNLPSTTKTPTQLRREIAEAIEGYRRPRRRIR